MTCLPIRVRRQTGHLAINAPVTSSLTVVLMCGGRGRDRRVLSSRNVEASSHKHLVVVSRE